MSFAYLPLYTGDYQRDTLHLSMLEHGAYLKLLMYCWDQQGPAPIDERKLMGICNARSKEEITAMQGVLVEFFIRTDEGWFNKRLEQELKKAEMQSRQAHERGMRSAESRRQKYGTAQPFESLSKASRKAPEILPNPPSPSPSPSPKEKLNTHTRFAAREYLSARGLSDQTITDYLAIRKDKKLTPTAKAMEAIEQEADKAGITFAKAIEICSANAWAGFKASWLAKVDNENPDYSSVGD